MTPRITHLAFDEWVAHVFDHDVGKPEWYFDVDSDVWDAPPAMTIEYMTRLFEHPIPRLGRYTDEQLAQGFWYLVPSPGSEHMLVLLDETVPFEARARCLRSMRTLFAEVFAVRCPPYLAHLDEPGAGALNIACYMWWEIMPFGPQLSGTSRKRFDTQVVTLMRDILAIDAIPPQESALHGLDHWITRRYQRTIRTIIDRFIDRNPSMRSELLAYARRARDGGVQ